MTTPLRLALLVLAAALGAPLQARDSAGVAHGVPGVSEAQLAPDFWVRRLPAPDQVLLDAAAIAAQNARLQRLDPTIHDLRALPPVLRRAQVAGWIGRVSVRPTRPLFAADGTPVPTATLDALVEAVDLAAILERQPTRHGLVVRRADLRTFPTAMRVFTAPGETDLDRFQESALFPGTPVVLAHASRDGTWWFVVSPTYTAWIEQRHVAEGPATDVLGYAERTPFRAVTGAVEHTVHAPEAPALSRLPLDMGVRLPLRRDWPPDQPVNGQHPSAAHVVDLPVRADDGTLRIAPALLPRSADSAAGYLPLTRANLVRQAFKFLGERYGWGHAYDGRDCSGFAAEVYRSMGVLLPRNTGDQAASPALHRRVFTAGDDDAARAAAVRALEAGDLVYIPGHVMLVIGRIDGEPYLIHDTAGINVRDGAGLRRLPLNGVAVTPLTPLRFDERAGYVDRITSIVRPYLAAPEDSDE